MGKRIIQKHHISYNPEEIVMVYKGEHNILTKIQWYTRKTVSAGFIRALKVFIALSENKTVELYGKEGK